MGAADGNSQYRYLEKLIEGDDDVELLAMAWADGMRGTVTYNYPIMMPIIGPLFGSTIPLTGTATNIILQPACP